MTTAVVTDGGADLREYVQEWALVDIEASGLRPSEHRVLSLAVITLGPDGQQRAEYSTLVDPGPSCDPGPVHIHGLSAEQLRGAPDFSSIARRVAELLRGRVMVAHNALFDYGFLSEEFARAGVELPVAQRLCTLALNRRIGPPTTDLKLGTLAAYYGVRQTRTILVWSALNMGASEAEVFRRVVLPSAAPMILASLRVSLALSFIVMFAAEMINARSGLGHLIRVAENSLRFDLMYVSLVSIAILGYAGDRLVRFSQNKFLAWQQPAQA
jgi:hypothetical protein